ncbi:MAG TPA: hypothetical protein VFD04_05990 [Actinomycetes bacterium]|nr:hypothetical protein [Actinomycetes bacterium]
MAAALRRQLGDAVLAIDHIGSTSVPTSAPRRCPGWPPRTPRRPGHRGGPGRRRPARARLPTGRHTGGTNGRPATPAIPAGGRSACGRPHLARGCPGSRRS